MEENEGKNSKFTFECHMAIVNFSKEIQRDTEGKLGSNVEAAETSIVDGTAMKRTLDTSYVQYPLKGEGKGKEAEEKGTEKTEES